MNEDFDFFIRDGKVMAYDFNSFVGGIAEAYRQGYEIVDPHKADKNGIQRYVHIVPAQEEAVEEQSVQEEQEQQQSEDTSTEGTNPEPEQQETNVDSAEEETDTGQTDLEDAVSPSSVTTEDVSHLTKDFIEQVKQEDGLVGLKELGAPFGITDRSKDKLAKKLLTFAERVRGNVS